MKEANFSLRCGAVHSFALWIKASKFPTTNWLGYAQILWRLKCSSVWCIDYDENFMKKVLRLFLSQTYLPKQARKTILILGGARFLRSALDIGFTLIFFILGIIFLKLIDVIDTIWTFFWKYCKSDFIGTAIILRQLSQMCDCPKKFRVNFLLI